MKGNTLSPSSCHALHNLTLQQVASIVSNSDLMSLNARSLLDWDFLSRRLWTCGFVDGDRTDESKNCSLESLLDLYFQVCILCHHSSEKPHRWSDLQIPLIQSLSTFCTRLKHFGAHVSYFCVDDRAIAGNHNVAQVWKMWSGRYQGEGSDSETTTCVSTTTEAITHGPWHPMHESFSTCEVHITPWYWYKLALFQGFVLSFGYSFVISVEHRRCNLAVVSCQSWWHHPVCSYDNFMVKSSLMYSRCRFMLSGPWCAQDKQKFWSPSTESSDRVEPTTSTSENDLRTSSQGNLASSSESASQDAPSTWTTTSSSAELNTCYKLHGVVNHLGQNAFGGHFVTDIFDPEADRWLRCDDSLVTDVRHWNFSSACSKSASVNSVEDIDYSIWHV